MKYEILLLGKTKDSFIAEGIDEYAGRLGHYAPVNLKIIKVKKKQGSAQKIMENEADLLLGNLSNSTYPVALDSRGKQLSSVDFAKEIQHLENRGVNHISFLIGGPLGLSSRVLKEARMELSLSKMTFTHDLVRLLLVEQLYRAHTIIAGGKYHK